jgi:hypothetical protein
MGGLLVAFVPASQKVVVINGPEAITEGPSSVLGVHSAGLTRLVMKAIELGIQDLPLHPLALLPDSSSDPILSLPGRQHLLHGHSLGLYVTRHEYAEIRAFRYLVEHNLSGLAPFLRQYSTLPWRVELAIEDQSTPTTFDAHIRSITRIRADRDEVVVVSEFRESVSLWIGSSSIHAYRGVVNGAYELLERDVGSLLGGSDPLGSDVL